MATNFPTSLDSLTNPTTSDTLATVSHSGQHADANDAIEALQTKVGVDNSAVATSLDYLVRSACPIGSVMPFAGSSSPDATWLICDGSAISRVTYAELFAVLGVTYGAGDGSTTFNIPNMKGRVPVGFDSGQTEFDALGETGGAKTHTLTESEMPSHTHTQNAHTHTQNSHEHAFEYRGSLSTYGGAASNRVYGDLAGGGSSKVLIPPTGFPNSPTSFSAANMAAWGNHAVAASTTASNQNTTATNQNTGGGSAHNILQPYIALNYIMKAA